MGIDVVRLKNGFTANLHLNTEKNTLVTIGLRGLNLLSWPDLKKQKAFSLSNGSFLLPTEKGGTVILSTAGRIYLYENETLTCLGNWPKQYWDEFGSHCYIGNGLVASTYNMNPGNRGFSEFGGVCVYDIRQKKFREICWEKHRYFEIIRFKDGYFSLLTGVYHCAYDSSRENPILPSEIWTMDLEGQVKDKFTLPVTIYERYYNSYIFPIGKEPSLSDREAFLLFAAKVVYKNGFSKEPERIGGELYIMDLAGHVKRIWEDETLDGICLRACASDHYLLVTHEGRKKITVFDKKNWKRLDSVSCHSPINKENRVYSDEMRTDSVYDMVALSGNEFLIGTAGLPGGLYKLVITE